MANVQPTDLKVHVQEVGPDHMHMVLPGLYLGNAFAARNERHLRSNGISHVLSVTRDEYPVGAFTGLRLCVDDYPDEDLLVHFTHTKAFIEQAVSGGGGVLGVSRSVTIVAAYLMATRSMSTQEAIQFIKARRPIANPNAGFIRQLEIYGTASYDMNSDKGKAMYKTWQEDRDATYAALVQQLEAV